MTPGPGHVRPTSLSPGRERLIMLAADVLVLPFALWCAFALRFSVPWPGVAHVWWLFPVAIASAVPVSGHFGLYRAGAWCMESQSVYAVLTGVTVSAVVLAVATGLSGVDGVPLSVFVIYWALAVLLAGGTRYAARHLLQRQPLPAQPISDPPDLIDGRPRNDAVRDMDVKDLLGRDTVPPIDRLLDRCIRAKSVMVTGAGGSIGSELCRQMLGLHPRRIVLFESSELALYSIERELCASAREQGTDTEIVAILGSAHHMFRVRDVVRTFGVQTIYHAAAYKHVPIVEQNMVEGVHNNIFGTYHTAEAAIDADVDTFVLVSTDKAVAPTSVMGATKRFAELVLQGLNQRGVRTRFCMVRFGNVLESSGSVVPVFRDQIRRGGPVTVTHPEITRYFTTITEAAQLVLQAGSMGTGGDVFVLDMGEPVRIADLARRMITLSGRTVRDDRNPDGDIEIAYTGLRPAEKLYEELLIGNSVSRTEHPMILRAEEKALPWEQVRRHLDELLDAVQVFDCERARDLLRESVNEYGAAPRIEDIVFRRKAERANAADVASDDVTPVRPVKR